MTEHATTAIDAATQAGRLVLETFRKGLQSYTYKDTHNIVTETDVAAEGLILNILRSRFPDHSFFSEEAGKVEGNQEYLWVIDPIDGTTNFSRSIPHFNVSIALLQSGVPIVGVVFDPVADELYVAEKGKGSTINNSPLKVSTLEELNRAFVSITRISGVKSEPLYVEVVRILSKNIRTLRTMNATALDLCYVAAGRFDAFVCSNCNLYDYAAGSLIAGEAGAALTRFNGNDLQWEEDSTDILVANPALSNKLIPLLKDVV